MRAERATHTCPCVFKSAAAARNTTVMAAFGSGCLLCIDIDGRVLCDSEAQDGLPATGATSVSASSHMCAAVCEGTLYTWGIGTIGVLGRGVPGNDWYEHVASVPRAIFNNRRVKMAACGWMHTLALVDDNTVFSCGVGHSGSLGHGNTDIVYDMAPITQPVFAAQRIVYVAAGVSTSLGLSDVGRVWIWGSGKFGELGFDDEEMRLVPTLMPDFGHVVMASMSQHTKVVTKADELYAWGGNESGQCGLGDEISHSTPTRVECAPVASVAVGAFHTIVLTKAGKVFTCGRASLGALGRDEELETTSVLTPVDGMPSVRFVAAARNRSLAVTRCGTVFRWGADPKQYKPYWWPDYKAIVSPHGMFTPTLFTTPTRIGQYGLGITAEYALAFAMGAHKRLGSNSAILLLSEDAVYRVLEACVSLCPPHEPEGRRRLNGGSF